MAKIYTVLFIQDLLIFCLLNWAKNNFAGKKKYKNAPENAPIRLNQSRILGYYQPIIGGQNKSIIVQKKFPILEVEWNKSYVWFFYGKKFTRMDYHDVTISIPLPNFIAISLDPLRGFLFGKTAICFNLSPKHI